MDGKRLIEILKASAAVDPVALNSAIMDHERWGNDIIRSLLDKHAVRESDLVPLLSKAWGVPGADLANFRPEPSVVRCLSSELADGYRAVPLRIDGAFLDVAFEAPLGDAIDAVRVHTQLNVRAHVASPRSIDRLVAQYYGRMSVCGYQVDPRVTSGNFLRSDMLEISDSDSEMEVGESSLSIAVDMSNFEDTDAEAPGDSALDLASLHQTLLKAEQRIKLLEAHVARDEDVLRRLFGYLVDKGIGTREEIVALLR